MWKNPKTRIKSRAVAFSCIHRHKDMHIFHSVASILGKILAVFSKFFQVNYLTGSYKRNVWFSRFLSFVASK